METVRSLHGKTFAGMGLLVALLAVSPVAWLTGCGSGDPVGIEAGDSIIFINGYPDDPPCPWRLQLPAGQILTGLGDSTLVDMPSGRYTITWDQIDDFHQPQTNPHHQIIGSADNVTFTGIYTPIAYTYPHVPWVETGPAPLPGDVAVTWLWYLSGEHPTDHYEIALSTTGPVTNENWNQADFIHDQPHFGNLISYTEIFNGLEGLDPGTQVWGAVVAVDATGWRTEVVESPSTIVSSAWWASGSVIDHLGRPLVGVVVGCNQAASAVVTGADGSYVLGPLVDQSPVIFTTDASALDPLPGTAGWYDYTGIPLDFDGNSNFDILVLPRFPMDSSCDSYGDNWLTFFRYLTKTNTTDFYRPDYHFCGWNDYPVRVLVPDHVRPADGLDFGAQARQALGYWNLLTGLELVALTQDPDQAQVHVVFEDLGSLANGITLQLEPAGFQNHFGYVDPQTIQLGINDVILPTAQRVQETVLHEMGHALGFYRHVQGCTQSGYLMSLTAAGILDDGPENAAHQDEIRAMQVLRHLPRWMDLSGFHPH